MSIGDTSPVSTRSTFLLVNSDSGFSQKKYEGVLGLALYNSQDSFLYSLINNQAIPQYTFALYLNNVGNTASYGNLPSNLEIGTYNLAKYTKSSSFAVTIPVIQTEKY